MTGTHRIQSKTFFDWVQPSMAADGLIVVEPWQAEHAALAAAQFTDTRLQQTAMIIAALHRHVIDYIAQAPVLVLAVAGARRDDLRSRSIRLALATRFIAAAGPSHRLPHILRAYGLVPPLRRLAGAPLRSGHFHLLATLATVPESALAQVVPATAEAQRSWLDWLDGLGGRHWARHAARDRFVAWAAANIRSPEAMTGAGELADWAMLAPGRFDPAMSFEQARAASARWHEEQAAMQRSLPSLFAGAEHARVVDYAPLPTEIEVDGLTFRALATLADLDEESRRMHHCVRSYWRFVARGTSRIFSVRRGDQRLATLELQRGRHPGVPGPMVIEQLKAACNARPPAEVVAAAAHFLEIANSRVIEALRTKAAVAAAAKPEMPGGRRRRRKAGAVPAATGQPAGR